MLLGVCKTCLVKWETVVGFHSLWNEWETQITDGGPCGRGPV